MELLDKLLHPGFLALQRHADHGKTTALVLVVHADQRGGLDEARSAPRRPEVHQHHLALIVREPQLLAINGSQSKVVIPVGVRFRLVRSHSRLHHRRLGLGHEPCFGVEEGQPGRDPGQLVGKDQHTHEHQQHPARYLNLAQVPFHSLEQREKPAEEGGGEDERNPETQRIHREQQHTTVQGLGRRRQR